MRELIAAKSDDEYGVSLTTAAKVEILVRQARSQVEIAVEIVRLGR
ncbi:hypothetical protein [Haloechinothrix alba]|nr:hypothetical protein [Haloechinothrix alba]